MTDTTTFAKIDARVIALNRTHNYFIDEKPQAFHRPDRGSLPLRQEPAHALLRVHAELLPDPPVHQGHLHAGRRPVERSRAG